MKFAKTKEKVQHRPKEERKICYKEYDDEQALKDDMEKDENIWVRHQYDKPIDDVGQKAYENFVSGFLYFYDIEVRNNSIDHVVHFKWEQRQTGQNDKNFVTVYLNPPALHTPTYATPASAPTDPPRPTGPPPPSPGG